MDFHVKEFYRQYSDETPSGNFHRVIPLHDAPDISWNQIHSLVPNLPKGWLELAHLSCQDRIDFIKDFWTAKLPFRPGLNQSLDSFFSMLDDIGIYVTQKSYADAYESHLVYSFKEDAGFFRGNVPITDKEILDLTLYFPQCILPSDYLAFLQIHNGFCKTTDATGLISSPAMPQTYESFQAMLQSQDPILTKGGAIVDPKSLIPFYESFGMPFFQCFWADWYPEDEMGNVYYSSDQKTISDVTETDYTTISMAFPTFADWLMFYLERLV